METSKEKQKVILQFMIKYVCNINIYASDYATDSLKAVRAMEILGMLILGLALLFGVIKLCKKSEQLAFFVAAGCLAIVAGKHFYIEGRESAESKASTVNRTRTKEATEQMRIFVFPDQIMSLLKMVQNTTSSDIRIRISPKITAIYLNGLWQVACKENKLVN